MAESIVESGGLVPDQPAHWTLDVAVDYLALRRALKLGHRQWFGQPPLDEELDTIIDVTKQPS